MKLDAERPFDALSLLIDDHRSIRGLMLEIRRLAGIEATQESKSAIAKALAKTLSIHAYLEDEFLFPAVTQVKQDDDNEIDSQFDQEDEQFLIEALESLSRAYVRFDDKLIELMDQIDEHIRFEETQLFPWVRTTNINLVTLGVDMLQHRSTRL